MEAGYLSSISLELFSILFQNKTGHLILQIYERWYGDQVQKTTNPKEVLDTKKNVTQQGPMPVARRQQYPP